MGLSVMLDTVVLVLDAGLPPPEGYTRL